MGRPVHLRIEVCSSCLRAAGLVTNREERESFFARVRERVTDQRAPLEVGDDLRIEVGQCQRLCPPDRVTIAESEILPEDHFGEARLGVTESASEDAVVDAILKRTSV